MLSPRSRFVPGIYRLSACQQRRSLFVVIPLLLFFSLPGPAAGSDSFRFNKHNEVIGRVGSYTVRENESLYEIARSYKTGFNEIVEANPGVDPIIPGKGTKLVLPTAWILPDVKRAPGIVINLSEMRLYYFFKRKGRVLVRTYPIGIGDDGAGTPLGSFRIIEKIANPAWHVPASIRRERPELPAVVPPGPENPMGSHALRLSRNTVLIHGTDMPWGIGRKITHGCIRLYPEDIVELFRLVPVKTRVKIVRQPAKAGVSRGRVYVEVNEDADLKSYDYLGTVRSLLKKKHLFDKVNPDKLAQVVKEKRGYPVDVSRAKSRGT